MAWEMPPENGAADASHGLLALPQCCRSEPKSWRRVAQAAGTASHFRREANLVKSGSFLAEYFDAVTNCAILKKLPKA
jgi:hypothetical protein